MEINDILFKLRNIMEINDLDAYIVPTGDPHGSEYVPDHYNDRDFVSGFTGSFGLALITKEKALLWTDGRYFIQASRQLSGSEYELMKSATPGYDSYEEYLYKNLEPNSRVGLNGLVFMQSAYEQLANKLKDKAVEVVDIDLISGIWEDRPSISKESARIHEEKYAGLKAIDKINLVRNELLENNVTMTVLSSLDDLAWLYNIRGNDICYNPVVVSYGVVSMQEVILFSDTSKFNKQLLDHFAQNNIKLRDYDEVFEYLKNVKDEKIILNKEKTNHKIYSLIEDCNEIINKTEITTELKAVKNIVELENQKNAYIKDGVALTRFIYWLQNSIDLKETNEFEVAEKLTEFRKEQDLFIDNSFGVISAYGANGAMMHYKATKESNSNLDTKGLYLVDSGGQFLDGTTDTTRTIALGKLTYEEKRDFTLVLKGNLALCNAIFLEGSTGFYLDAIARYPIWQHCIDYKSGTGHGVGYFLSVHEGPHRIGPAYNNVVLKPGMVVTVEPGIYKENKHGIRIENVVYVKEVEKNEHGNFLAFEMMTYVPIDTNAIEVEMLTDVEKMQLNNYNEKVFKTISPYLEGAEKDWLKEVTREV